MPLDPAALRSRIASLANPHPFDPTYGYDLERLLQVAPPEEQEGFASFWQETYRQAREVPLNLAHRKIASPHPDFDLYEAEYNSLGGARIGAWITVPKAMPASPDGWVVGHGYGGREAPGFDLPAPAGPAIYFCARGFHRSAHPRLPNTSAWHVIHGIASRETYIHRGCAADVWASASALLELFPAVRRLRYSGGSFGGGIGALATPWDERFHHVFLDIPSFGNHPLRVQMPCAGSGEAVRTYRRTHPEVMKVLQWFDAATAARHFRVPVFVAAAAFDPAVPPPGQFSIYNAIPSRKALFVRTAAHFASPFEAEENAGLKTKLADWFQTA